VKKTKPKKGRTPPKDALVPFETKGEGSGEERSTRAHLKPARRRGPKRKSPKARGRRRSLTSPKKLEKIARRNQRKANQKLPQKRTVNRDSDLFSAKLGEKGRGYWQGTQNQKPAREEGG